MEFRFERPRLRLGYVPNRRDSFADPAFLENKKAVDKVLKKLVKECDIELVSTDKLKFPAKTLMWGKRVIEMPADKVMTDYSDGVMVAEYLKEQKVDALFFAFLNFGQEEAVAKVAKELNVPVLVWGPRDPMPDGIKGRPLDTQCGLFAATKVLQRYGVKFTYIENCAPTDKAFAEGFKQFISTANIVKNFRGARVAQISVRPSQFMSVIVNEGELLEKFGIEIVPITATTVSNTAEYILEHRKDEVDALVADIEKTIDMSRLGEKKYATAAFELALMDICRDHGCNALACECWSSFRSLLGIGVCFVLGDLNDRGLPAACETDVHAAISALLAIGAAGNKQPSFIADLTIRHPEDDNCELLWHCGPFAKSLKKEGAEGYIVEGGQGYYPIKNGEMTTIRFDGVGGEYKLFIGKGEGIDGPVTNGNYVWLKVDDWVKWEKKFMYGPYIHHLIGVYGDYTEALKDACRYIGVTVDTPDMPLF